MESYIPCAIVFGLICIDYVSGVIGSIVNKDFSSSKMREGLIHKSAYVLVFALAELVKVMSLYYDLGIAGAEAIVGLVIVWVSVTEIGSILENLVKINPELNDSRFFEIFGKEDIEK